MSNDYPTHRVDLLIDEMLWPNQPMGRDVGGTIESVKAIRREDLVGLMQRQYGPDNVVISVAGGVSHEEVLGEIEDAVGDWTPRNPMEWSPAKVGQREASVRVEYKEAEQAHICVGMPALRLDHPDRYALSLANIMLGEGMSSRLFLEIREKLGLAYDVHSSLSQYRDCGSLVVYCGSEPSRSRKSLEAIMGQLAAMREGFSERELAKAREYSKGRIMLRMEDTRSVAMWQGGQELLLNRVSSVEDVVRAIEGVTLEDVNRVAGELADERRMNLAVVGPFEGDAPFKEVFGG